MSSVLKAAQASRQQNPPKKEEDVQAVCVEYGGEMVQCVLGHKKVRFVVRKHREVIFDFELGDQANYSVEAASDRFFCPKLKSVTKKVSFKDGEKTHIWVGREFKGDLILRKNGAIQSRHNPNVVDPKKYDLKPETKPEPLLIAAKKADTISPAMCTREDPFGLGQIYPQKKNFISPLMDELDRYGTSFSYTNVLKEQPEVHEYAAITIADQSEILTTAKDTIARLGYFEGTATSAFALAQKSGGVLMNASLQVLEALGDSNTFKESAGYIQEHWKHLDKLLMKVRIEPAPIGKYKIIFVGKPIRSISSASKQAAGAIVRSKPISQSIGSAKTSWLDGGFTRRGRDGFGGAKRMFLTSASNFKSGMKIGAIGTVIDLMLDVKAVFGENGSKDFSEFIGRAGVSIAKAGATAALGGLFAAVSMTILFTAGIALPVAAVALVVVAGYIAAATIVDTLDSSLSLKERAAHLAR